MNVSASETRCPICGTRAETLDPWLEIPVDVKTGRKIDTGRLVWCKACDVGMMRRAMTPNEVTRPMISRPIIRTVNPIFLMSRHH